MRPILYHSCAVVAAGLIGGLVSAASAAPMISATSGAAVGNANPDPNDAFNGATVDSSYAVVVSAVADNMFGASTGGEPGHTIFDNNTGAVDTTAKTQTNVTFVNFHTAAPVTIGGYNLYLQGDGNDNYAGHREATFVRLYASNDGGTTYGVALSAVQINPELDYGQHFPDPSASNYASLYGSNAITVSDTFTAPAAYQYYRVELMTDPWASPNGIRVVELDAAPVPEPASMGLVGLGLMGLLHRRRR